MICDLSGYSDGVRFSLFYFLIGIEFRLVVFFNVGLAFAFCVSICCWLCILHSNVIKLLVEELLCSVMRLMVRLFARSEYRGWGNVSKRLVKSFRTA